MKRRPFGRTGVETSMPGIGDLADRAIPLDQCVATVRRAMDHGLNLVDTAPGYEERFPNEQDAAFQAFAEFQALRPAQVQSIEARAARAIESKGRCCWNPTEH